jgi:hypothetical protein
LIDSTLITPPLRFSLYHNLSLNLASVLYLSRACLLPSSPVAIILSLILSLNQLG